MPRAKGGVVLRRRHNKILKITKGQRMSRHLLWHRANEAMLKSLFYASRDRRGPQARHARPVDRPYQRGRSSERHHLQPADPRFEDSRYPAGPENPG